MGAFFGLLGLVGAITGLVMLIKAKKKNEAIKTSIIVLCVGFGLFFIGVTITGNSGNSTNVNGTTNTTEATTAGTTAETTTAQTTTQGTTTTVATTASATKGEQNALRQSKQYLSISGFSKKGLIKQLEFEGYSTSEANYAVNNCGADWKEQAVKKAKEYLSLTSFSKKGLIQQLQFEGFTDAEATYGAEQNGY